MDSDTYLRKLERDMTSGFLHLLVLEHIGRLQPIHGYALIRAMHDTTGAGMWKEGTVYPLLATLERNGLLQSAWGSADNGPRRKEYRLTATGRDMRDLVALRWKDLRSRLDAILEGTPWQK